MVPVRSTAIAVLGSACLWLVCLWLVCLWLVCLCLVATCSPVMAADTLEAKLQSESLSSLARAAEQQGDAERGAMLFHQPNVGCAKCHLAPATFGVRNPGDTSSETSLGPDLSRVARDPALDPRQVKRETIYKHLIESILAPSKAIRKGYEAWQVVDSDGRSITGFLVEESAERLIVRDVSTGERLTLATASIESRRPAATSIMPAGQVNQLADRQQFLDLVRYLAEIAEGGPARAVALRPTILPAPVPVPAYELQVDHAAFLTDWENPQKSAESLQRGEQIYRRLCINCHGTREQPGSLPTSLRFAEGRFRNGSDPYRIYQTLTHGFGLMAAQTWMVPQQKYDVIHFLREHFLRPHNPSQFTAIDRAYLAALPKGDTRGPAPSSIEPWSAMDYGPFLISTYETRSDNAPGKKTSSPNLAYKGMAIRLDAGVGGVARGGHWMIFEHDTMRMSAAWSRSESERGPQFIDWRGIHFDGAHGAHPHTVGQVRFANPPGPGWAEPATAAWDDPRVVGRDQRKYGPLPRSWAQFQGFYQYGDRVVLSYRVGSTPIWELPGIIVSETDSTVTRQLQVGPREKPLTLLVATQPDDGLRLESLPTENRDLLATVLQASGGAGSERLAVGVVPAVNGMQWVLESGGRLCLRIPAGETPLRFIVGLNALSSEADQGAKAGSQPFDPKRLVAGFASLRDQITDLTRLTNGGPRRWPEVLTSVIEDGDDQGPFAVDRFVLPSSNPWLAQLRLSGIDFYPDGDTAAVCSWDGDVWLIRGLLAPAVDDRRQRPVTWQRIASGLFQPLGLKIVEGRIYVGCRDQIVILRDLNGDGETDFYECFNSDHQVTEHFHEFAMGLQIDEAGNFYYAKSARHALPAIVPQHGTLLRVSADGKATEILANGFRAANGVCLNPDGSFVVTDQEGHWNPKNRINWVRPVPKGERPRFYGNMFGYHDVTDSSNEAMEQPLCWITNAFDRSPAELLWVTSDRWGPLKQSLLNLSYGYGKAYVVPFEKLSDGNVQGGMCELPLPAFPTGIMRGRFHPVDGQLYVCGMFAWAGNATQPGGLYRIRYTGKAVHLPVGLHVRGPAVEIEFTDPIDPDSVTDLRHFAVKCWNLKRSADYGSQHHDERELPIAAAKLSDDGKTLRLELPDLAPTWCMSISYAIQGRDGMPVKGQIHNTIHSLNR